MPVRVVAFGRSAPELARSIWEAKRMVHECSRGRLDCTARPLDPLQVPRVDTLSARNLVHNDCLVHTISSKTGELSDMTALFRKRRHKQ
jgi:hypothetical protein